MIGGRDAGGMAKKDICTELALYTGNFSDLPARDLTAHRYKLALRDRQATRGRREEERGLLDILVGARELNSWTEER